MAIKTSTQNETQKENLIPSQRLKMRRCGLFSSLKHFILFVPIHFFSYRSAPFICLIGHKLQGPKIYVVLDKTKFPDFRKKLGFSGGQNILFKQCIYHVFFLIRDILRRNWVIFRYAAACRNRNPHHKQIGFYLGLKLKLDSGISVTVWQYCVGDYSGMVLKLS